MVPPRSMVFVGDGDFRKQGEEFRKYFVDLAGLQPSHRILDVGCGIGRMAIPLTEYLSGGGAYYGIDIVKMGIDWCNKKITHKYPNFQFVHSNIYNKLYNPKGTLKAREYVFPFETESFDFVFLTSVFTHMLTNDMENYLKEISRVVKKDGTCLITFFLLNEESHALMRQCRSRLDFKYQLDGCMSSDEAVPESAIAFEQTYVHSVFKKHGFQIQEPIHFGSWCGREKHLSYQDIIIARKTVS